MRIRYAGFLAYDGQEYVFAREEGNPALYRISPVYAKAFQAASQFSGYLDFPDAHLSLAKSEVVSIFAAALRSSAVRKPLRSTARILRCVSYGHLKQRALVEYNNRRYYYRFPAELTLVPGDSQPIDVRRLIDVRQCR